MLGKYTSPMDILRMESKGWSPKIEDKEVPGIYNKPL